MSLIIHGSPKGDLSWHCQKSYAPRTVSNNEEPLDDLGGHFSPSFGRRKEGGLRISQWELGIEVSKHHSLNNKGLAMIDFSAKAGRLPRNNN